MDKLASLEMDCGSSYPASSRPHWVDPSLSSRGTLQLHLFNATWKISEGGLLLVQDKSQTPRALSSSELAAIECRDQASERSISGYGNGSYSSYSSYSSYGNGNGNGNGNYALSSYPSRFSSSSGAEVKIKKKTSSNNVSTVSGSSSPTSITPSSSLSSLSLQPAAASDRSSADMVSLMDLFTSDDPQPRKPFLADIGATASLRPGRWRDVDHADPFSDFM